MRNKYEYVKAFQVAKKLLPNCWAVVRIDGKGFHKFSNDHGFEKPNDLRALNLLNAAATDVMRSFTDVTISYGQSDEFSFVIRKNSATSKLNDCEITSRINSLFSSSYVHRWGEYFANVKLRYPPAFDSRVVLYPSDKNLRDYLSWRQADCHINNLYNTTFWSLIQRGGLDNKQVGWMLEMMVLF